MGKNKKKKSGKTNIGISPERFMREKARNNPLDKCYLTKNWQEKGLAHVIVTRRRKDGDLCMGVFLVDTYCLGVKDVTYSPKVTDDKIREFIWNAVDTNSEFREATYEEVHNLILGAIEFAEEAGIEPHKDFDIAAGILEEDRDDIPLISYDYGKDGCHLLIVGPSGKESKYIRPLKEKLGDKFHYIAPLDTMEDDILEECEFSDDLEDWEDDGLDSDVESLEPDWNDRQDVAEVMLKALEKIKADRERFPDEMFEYEYPEYQGELRLHNQYIWKELKKSSNRNGLPRKVVDEILSLDKDEVAEDLSIIILYMIGRVYPYISPDGKGDYKKIPDLGSAMYNALSLMTVLKNPRCFDAVLELNRQNFFFVDYFCGDDSRIIRDALYCSDPDAIDKILSQLNEIGVPTLSRVLLIEYLLMRVYYRPELRGETVAILRDYMDGLPEKIKQRRGGDTNLAGFLACSLLDFRMRELLPEVEYLYENNLVNDTIVTLKEVKKEIPLAPDYRFDYFAVSNWIEP